MAPRTVGDRRRGPPGGVLRPGVLGWRLPSPLRAEEVCVKPRLWSRNYVLALVVGFFLSMVFYMLMTSMALYAFREFGADQFLSGLAASIFVVGAVIARLFAGALVDRLGRRRVMLVTLVLSALAALAYFAAGSLVLLLVIRLVHGIVFGAAHTAASAIVQSLIPASRRGEGTGYYGGTVTLATAVGPFIAVLVTRSGGYSGVFVASVAGTFLALCAGIVLRAPADATQPLAKSPSRRHRQGLIEMAAVPIGSFALVTTIAFSGVVAFVNSYAEQIQLTSAAAVFFLVYAGVVVVLRPFVGRLQDTGGDNIVMYPATVLLAAGLGVLAITTNGAMLLLAAALLGAGWGTTHSACQAIAVARVPITRVGRSVSTYFLLADVGMGLGPVVLGLLVGPLGFRGMYGVLAAAIVLLGLPYYWAVHGRRHGHVPRAAHRREPSVG